MSLHPAALVVAIVVAIRAAQLAALEAGGAVLPGRRIPAAQPGIRRRGLDVTLARFLIFTAWLRFFVRGEVVLDRWRPMDTAVCLWCGIGGRRLRLPLGPSGHRHQPGPDRELRRDVFLVRLCVTKPSDVANVKKAMMFAAAVLAAFLIVESSTGRNAFAIFGGVPEITEIRDGHLRCQGPFGSSDQRRPLRSQPGADLFRAHHGASSEGPARGGAGVRRRRGRAGGLERSVPGAGRRRRRVVLLALRRRMRAVAWGIVGVLATLHLVMKAPVWALIARASVFDSSSSWHRLNLLDQFIWRFGEWWLFRHAIDGSLGLLRGRRRQQLRAHRRQRRHLHPARLLPAPPRGFTSIGAAMRASKSFEEQTLLWGLGGALMAHVVGAFGLSYWDQTTVLFALLLGLISAASSAVRLGPVAGADAQGRRDSRERHRRITVADTR
jgi:hypothetical protein